jgi:hypothetical protein
MNNDIAANRISCKPQKLQAMFVTVKPAAATGGRSANGPKEMAATLQPWNYRGSVGDMATGQGWNGRRARTWRGRWTAAVQPRHAGCVMRTSGIGLRGRNLPGQAERLG